MVPLGALAAARHARGSAARARCRHTAHHTSAVQAHGPPERGPGTRPPRKTKEEVRGTSAGGGTGRAHGPRQPPTASGPDGVRTHAHAPHNAARARGRHTAAEGLSKAHPGWHTAPGARDGARLTAAPGPGSRPPTERETTPATEAAGLLHATSPPQSEAAACHGRRQRPRRRDGSAVTPAVDFAPPVRGWEGAEPRLWEGLGWSSRAAPGLPSPSGLPSPMLVQ